jgi:hypothetical protein
MGCVARIGRVLVRKTQMEQTTWKSNIKPDVKEIECEDVD